METSKEIEVNGSTKHYNLQDVKTHRTKDSAWIVYKNAVFDITDFLDNHPGGPEILLDVCGGDATAAFDDVGHSDHAYRLLKGYKIGELAVEESVNNNDTNPSKKCLTCAII